MNQFFLHKDLVANFYQLEVKSINEAYMRRMGCSSCTGLINQSEQSSHVWSRLFVGEQRRRYKNTVFFSEAKFTPRVLKLLHAASPCPSAHVTYHKWVGNKGRSCSIANLRLLSSPLLYSTTRGVAEYCHSSLTRMLDLMLRLEYSHIAFVGVDLVSAEHFYAVVPEYAHIRREVAGFDNMVARFARRLYNSSLHATAGRGVHHFIGRVAEERRCRTRMINLSPDGLLAKVKGLATVRPEYLRYCYHEFDSVGAEQCVLSLASRALQARSEPSSLFATPQLMPSKASSTPFILHQIGPRNTSRWTPHMTSWRQLPFRVQMYHDADLVNVVRVAFPLLATKVARMRAIVERTDICRLASLYVHGGVYADLDQELVSPTQLIELMATGKVVLPFEKGRLVGQSILISPPRHPLWSVLAARMVADYDDRCYETLNTGPDKLTNLWNEMCSRADPRLRDVVLHEGLINGQMTKHHATGKRSWKKKANSASWDRKNGRLGCPFHKANTTCWPEGRRACLGPGLPEVVCDR